MYFHSAAQLLEEIVKIAVLPRSPLGGWLAPTLGAIEFLQHLTQARTQLTCFICSQHCLEPAAADGKPTDMASPYI